MQLEFHQLDRRWEHLRVRHPGRQRRLLASLADSGQQTPIVVVEAEGQADRYVVIDGYKRIAALEQLGRDTVEVVGCSEGRSWCGETIDPASAAAITLRSPMAPRSSPPAVRSEDVILGGDTRMA